MRTSKKIRKQIAERYGLDYTPTECQHEGDCRGTCPRCDAELKELNRQLQEKGTDRLDDDMFAEMTDIDESGTSTDKPHNDSTHTTKVSDPAEAKVSTEPSYINDIYPDLQGSILDIHCFKDSHIYSALNHIYSALNDTGEDLEGDVTPGSFPNEDKDNTPSS